MSGSNAQGPASSEEVITIDDSPTTVPESLSPTTKFQTLIPPAPAENVVSSTPLSVSSSINLIDVASPMSAVTKPVQDEIITITESQPTQSSAEEDRIIEVQPTKANVLNLFRATQDQDAYNLYYVELLQKEHEEANAQAKPLLTTSLKEKLAERRKQKQQSKVASSPRAPSTPKSATTNVIVSTPTMAAPKTQSSAPSTPTGSAPAATTTPKAEPAKVVDLNDEDDEEEEQAPTLTLSDDDEVPNGEIVVEDDGMEEEQEEEEETFISFGTTDLPQNGEKASQIVPWMMEEYNIEHPALKLHKEIIDFYEFIKETKEEQELRQKVINQYTMYIKEIDKSASVALYGSYASGLMLPGSDLDFCINSRRFLSDPVGFLMRLRNLVQKKNAADKINLIRNARVPILSLVDKQTGQYIDFSCNSSNGLTAIETIKKFIQKYPAFKYLVAVLKYFLRQRGLNEVHKGGLGSYALCLMVASHLQMHSSNFSKEEMSTTSLGSLLIDFFALYGIYFNYFTTAIDVRGVGKYTPKTDRPRGDNFRLQAIDPTDPSNNVSRGSHNLLGIRNAFRTAFGCLTAQNYNSPSLLSRILAITTDLVQRRRNIFKDPNFIGVPKNHMQKEASHYHSDMENEFSDESNTQKKKRKRYSNHEGGKKRQRREQ